MQLPFVKLSRICWLALLGLDACLAIPLPTLEFIPCEYSLKFTLLASEGEPHAEASIYMGAYRNEERIGHAIIVLAFSILMLIIFYWLFYERLPIALKPHTWFGVRYMREQS